MGNLCLDMTASSDEDETKGNIAYTSERTDKSLSKYGAYTLVPSPTKKALRCYRQVNISSFRHNVKAIQKMATQTGCDIIAVLKANAYGHGAIKMAEICLKLGIKTFAVATVLEAIELRKCQSLMDKTIKIIVLGATVEDEYELYSQFHLDLMLSSPESAQTLLKWARSAQDKNSMINLHCMMDTGMTRIGFRTNECLKVIETIAKTGKDVGLKFVGLCTHFADAPNEEYTLLQFARFTSVLTKLEQNKISVEMFHCENSDSLMVDVLSDDTVKSYMDHDTKGYVRTGGAMYGATHEESKEEMKPMMSLYAQVRDIENISKGTPVGYGRTFVAEEDILIATLSIGYADGYPRGMSNEKQCVRIGDYVYDIAGRICMDMMMLNLGNVDKHAQIKKIKVGDYAVLFGPKEEHRLNMTLEDMCKRLKGGNYGQFSITCGITQRCPIVYVD